MSNQNTPEPRDALFGILGETAPARKLTANKTDFILRRDGSQITGFVVTDEHGGIGIIDKSAVRWLTSKEMRWLMHDSAQFGLMPNVSRQQSPESEANGD